MLIPSKGSWIQHPEEVKAKRFTTERRKKMNSFSYVVNSNLHQLFIVPCHTNGGLDSSWVPVSVDLPMFIKPRKGFENGIIETKEDYFKVFHPDEKIIEMPSEILSEVTKRLEVLNRIRAKFAKEK